MNIVENFDLYAPKLVDKEEYFGVGHRACQGCGEALAIRLMCKFCISRIRCCCRFEGTTAQGKDSGSGYKNRVYRRRWGYS